MTEAVMTEVDLRQCEFKVGGGHLGVAGGGAWQGRILGWDTCVCLGGQGCPGNETAPRVAQRQSDRVHARGAKGVAHTVPYHAGCAADASSFHMMCS